MEEETTLDEIKVVNSDITDLFIRYVIFPHIRMEEEAEEQEYKEKYKNSLVLESIEEDKTFVDDLTIVKPRLKPTPQILRTREITSSLWIKRQVRNMVERLLRIGRAYSTFAPFNKKMGWSLQEHFRTQAEILLEYFNAYNISTKEWRGLITTIWPPLKEFIHPFKFSYSSKKVGPLSDAKVSGRNDESADSEEETEMFF